jgi:hypothetical protein
MVCLVIVGGNVVLRMPCSSLQNLAVFEVHTNTAPQVAAGPPEKDTRIHANTVNAEGNSRIGGDDRTSLAGAKRQRLVEYRGKHVVNQGQSFKANNEKFSLQNNKLWVTLG